MNRAALFVALIILFSCKHHEDPKPTVPVLAAFSTKDVTGITDTSAVFTMEITTLGSASIIDYGFAWAIAESPTIASNVKNLGTTPTAASHSATIAGLTPSTKYFVRSVLTTSDGIVYGNEVSFATAETPKLGPAIITHDATAVSMTEATLRGEITGFGTTVITDYGFVWSMTPGVNINSPQKQSFGIMVNPAPFFYWLGALANATTYYYNVYTNTPQGVYYGTEKSFRTPADPWLKIAGFPASGRTGAVAFTINGKGYVGLGSKLNTDGQFTYFKDFWEYDPSQDKWTQKKDFGGGERSVSIAFTIGNKAYVGTGILTNYEQDIWEYSPETDEWTQKADFPKPAIYTSAFSIGNKGYVGTGFTTTLTTEFWEYDPEINQWTAKANFGGPPVDDGTGFAIGNRGYIGTGSYALGASKEFWEYNADLNQWTRKSDLPETHWSDTGFSLNGIGYVGLGNGSSADFSKYDPGTNSWSAAMTFPGGSRELPVSFVINGKAYIGLGAGGSDFSTEFWEYDPNRN